MTRNLNDLTLRMRSALFLLDQDDMGSAMCHTDPLHASAAQTARHHAVQISYNYSYECTSTFTVSTRVTSPGHNHPPTMCCSSDHDAAPVTHTAHTGAYMSFQAHTGAYMKLVMESGEQRVCLVSGVCAVYRPG